MVCYMSEAQYRVFRIFDLILRLHPPMISLHRIIKRGFMVRTFQRVKRFFTYNLPSWYQRPRAYWKNFYQWHLSQIPEEIEFQNKKIKNPARWKAVFVVHGMGMQRWAETAVELRSGFEDALEAIFKWQDANAKRPEARKIPAPYIHEGFWADYR